MSSLIKEVLACCLDQKCSGYFYKLVVSFYLVLLLFVISFRVYFDTFAFLFPLFIYICFLYFKYQHQRT